jgi:hypothetical protein
MKVFCKRFFTVLAVFALCLLSGIGTVHAKAATGFTVVNVDGKCRFLEGSYDAKKLNVSDTKEMSELSKKIKDGDSLTFYGINAAVTVELSVKLKELAVVQSFMPLVTAKSIETVYITGGSTAVVHCDVTNAYLYSDAVATFDGNVTNLIFAASGSVAPTPSVNTTGTISYFEKQDASGDVVQGLYDFKKGKFATNKGALITPAAEYKTSGVKPSDKAEVNEKKTDPKTFSKKMSAYADVFDATYYVEKYPDLKEAFGNDTKALFNHFLNCGMNEGRQGCADFDPKFYMSQYSDLQKAFGTDTVAYYIHYIQFGKKEGRKAVQ